MIERPTRPSRRSFRAAASGGLVAFALALGAGCGSSSSEDQVAAGGLGSGSVATNLGVALVDLVGEGDLFVFNVREEDQGGVDLNGDGDPFDRVMHVYDARTGSVINTELAAAPLSYTTATPEARTSDEYVVLPVDEAQQGAVDLNNDGDTEDLILHVFEPDTGAVRCIPYAAEPFVGLIGIALHPGFVAFTVPEAEQGNIDVNYDGDTTDRYVYMSIHNPGPGITVRISESASAELHVDPWSLVYSEREDDPFVGDRNGDGDAEDTVLVVRTLIGAMDRNVGQAGYELIDGPGQAWTFSVSERAQGETDLNGDGDVDDVVYTSYDPAQGLVHNHAVATGVGFSNRPSLGADLVAVRVEEEAMGLDLNGDGDTLDEVVHALDPATGETFNSGLAGHNPIFFDGGVGIDVDEVAQGGRDLDGDGIVGGRVVHVFEPRSGTVVNLGVRAQQGIGSEMQSAGRYLLFWRAESIATGDWNGDGDLSDSFLWWWDSVTNTLARMSRSGRRVGDLRDGTALVWVGEADESEDLNGDGNTFHFLVYALDLASGQLAETGLGGENPFGLTRLIDSRTALVQVPEVVDLEDLNGDGDNFDAVLFRVDLFR